jgi:hypothetical protein
LHAASLDRSRQVVTMVYDLGLYGTELDRIMAQADSRGVYAGATPAARMRNRALTHDLMLRQRDAVLNATVIKVAARADDTALNEILRMASTPSATINRDLVNEGVTAVKSSFEESMWDQLARTARGVSEFPCTKDQPSHCT